ncbi:MAG: type II toxin-antitoxin system VapC family toxin [Phycisphaerae bacterium]|jgi:predicted nucleic acid-binding protein
MRDFLVDTNIWGYWFNPDQEPWHSNVLKRVAELKQQCKNSKESFKIWISSVTWGEIEFGYRVQKKKDGSLETQFRQFVNDVAPIEYKIDKHVTLQYGRIRAMLFEKFGGDKKVAGRRPEQLIDPITSLQLQIQENDLWIVSQAITRNFTLVTNDTKSLRPLLDVIGKELYLENWAVGNQ